ncbi:MAG: efflux RND transporter periplasmic adaptor subunit [Candidatus Aminicenantes bacterium]
MKKYTRYFLIGMGLLLAAVILIWMPFQKSDKVPNQKQILTQEESREREILYYTCGMHPSVRVSPQDYQKGDTSCPICNMDLVPVYKEEPEQTEMGAEKHKAEEKIEPLVRLTPRARALASIETEEIQPRHLFKEIHTVGQMEYDERKIAYVAAWVPGRVDKLFVDFTGVRVRRRDPLVWIYSPELVTTQQEYLLALETLDRVKGTPHEETIRGAESLVEASRQRLLLWGINEKQLEELEKRRKANTHMTIYAPIGGTVIHKNVVEGQYVKEGENLYRIADLSNLWVLADIYEYEMSWVKEGQKVEIVSSAYPGEKFEGTISFINPYLEPQTRSVKVRVNVPNPQLKLKPGMYVNVHISSHIHPAPLAVPKSAVLDTGRRKLVYVEREAGAYTARQVELGPEAVDYVNGIKKEFYAVKAGLTEGMKVVTQANFLIDSQSQLTGQAEAVYGGALERKGEEKKPPSEHIH